MASSTDRRPAARAVAAALLVAAGVGATALPASAGTPVVAHRTYGADRYVTAALLENYSNRTTAYIVTGENFADGVTTGAVAGRPGSNLFLSPKGELPASVRKVIGYYSDVVVVGSDKTIGDSVVTWLQQNTRAKLSRVAGADRYDTAAQLSARSFSPGVPTVFVTTGTNYADALAASAAAVKVGAPVLTVPGGVLPASTRAELTRLKPGSIVVLGDEKSVTAGVQADLAAFTTGTVDRLAGVDRYDTAVKISERFFGPGVPFVQLASGTSWADAIAAGAKAGRSGSPLLLSPQNCIPQQVNLEIERLKTGDLQAVGGEGSYSTTAAKRTSCGAGAKTYLDELAAPSGNAQLLGANVTLNGVFYPRTVAYATYAPSNSSTDLPNGEYRAWSLGQRWTRFTTVAGVADGTTSGLTSTVQVFGDERLLGTYQVSVGHPAVIDLSVRGVANLKVVTTSSARTGSAEDDGTVFFGDAAVN